MKLPPELKAFEARLGYHFAQPQLLMQAMTHGSRTGVAGGDYQRFEFLGDRVLGLVMAEALLAADRAASEGQLAPRLNALVRKETCADVAREIDLGAVLRLGRSEHLSGGRRKQALLGDALEAVIAAIYFDNGYQAARRVVLRLWGARVRDVKGDARDAKTRLQEWAQARGLALPHYDVQQQSGADHAPVFTIEVRLGDTHRATAAAGTKRQAEQAAAAALLGQLPAE